MNLALLIKNNRLRLFWCVSVTVTQPFTNAADPISIMEMPDL
jgi:hypothetical protein